MRVKASVQHPTEDGERRNCPPGTLRVYEARPESPGWSIDAGPLACGYNVGSGSLGDGAGQEEGFRLCNRTQYHSACFINLSAAEVSSQMEPGNEDGQQQQAPLSPQGRCARVNLASLPSQLLEERVVDEESAAHVDVEVSRSMLSSSSDAAVLVVFTSTCNLWRIGLSVHGYEAGAVCGVGEYGDNGVPNSTVGLRHTMPPLLRLPINSAVRSTEPGSNETYSSATHNVTIPGVLGSMLMPLGRCVACPPGTAPLSWAASECLLKCPKGSSSATGLVPCASCPRNFFSDTDYSLTCKSCPDERPFTNSAGTVSIDECWYAHVEVENVRAVGRKLAGANFHSQLFQCWIGLQGTCQLTCVGCFVSHGLQRCAPRLAGSGERHCCSFQRPAQL